MRYLCFKLNVTYHINIIQLQQVAEKGDNYTALYYF